MKRLSLIIFTFILTINVAYAAGILGVWETENKRGKINIGQCGDSICGTVVKVAVKGALDVKNEDKKLRGRQILGMQIFELKQTSSQTRWDGKLYNSRDGKTYSGFVELLNDQQIKLEGCVFIFCKGEVWTKVKG